MADTDAIAAAIAKVKSKKIKKATPKGKAGGNGDGKAGNGKGKAAVNRAAGAGTSKRGAQGSSIRGSALANPVVPIVQQRAGPKARVIPTGQKLKYVFDIAKAKRTPLKYEVFKTEKDVDIEGALLEALQKHPQLVVDEISSSITYQPKYVMSSKDEVLRLIKTNPFGVMAAEIADSYPEARKHLDELYEDGAIFECGSTEKPSSIVYPNFYKPPGGLPAENIRDTLFDVQMPQIEEEIDKLLIQGGINKAKRSTPRLKMAVIQDDRKPVRERKQRKFRKVTNTHMEQELFNQDMPGPIDR